MARTSTKVTVTFSHRSGLTFRMVFHVDASVVDPDDPIILAIIEAIQALTASWPVRIEISLSSAHAVTPSSSAAYVNEDKAEFTFLDSADGLPHTFKVPGLLPSILDTLKTKIPVVAGVVQDYVDAVATNATGPGGEALVAPTFGVRRAGRKKLKK